MKSIKIQNLLLLIGLLISGASYANSSIPEIYPEIQVTLQNDSKEIACKNIKETIYYHCLKKGENVFISSQNGFHALSFNQAGLPKEIELKKITSDSTSLYQAPTLPDFSKILENEVVGDEPKKLPKTTTEDEFHQRVTRVADFFKEEEFQNAPLEIKETFHKIIQNKNNYAKDYTELIRGQKYSLSLSDGNQLTCDRLASKQANQKSLCGYFDCGKNQLGEDQILFYDTEENPGFYPTLQTFSKSGLKTSADVITLKSSQTQAIVSDVGNIFNDKNADIVKDREIAASVLPPELKHQKNNLDFIKDDFLHSFASDQKENCKATPLMTSYEQQKNNFLKVISEIPLKEFIQILEDGELLSNFMDYSDVVSQGCSYKGLFFNPKAKELLSKLDKDLYGDKNPFNSISEKKAKELFNKAKNMKDIAWNYRKDGCYARAHLMARRFEAEGVRVDKAWLKGDLYVPGTDIEWNYHVAPLVYVKDKNGKINKMIIDPSLFDKPVTLEEWNEKIAKKTAGKAIRTSFPFPQNAAYVERAALAISSSDPYTPGESFDVKEEDKLELAQQTMEEYLQFNEGDNEY